MTSKIETPVPEAPKKRGRFKVTNLKIGTRVSLGFGLLVLFMAIVGGDAYFGISTANKSFQEYRGMSRQTTAMGRIQANLLTARLGVKDFILSGSDEAAETVQSRLATLDEIIAESRGLFDDEAHLAAMDEIITDMNIYHQSFEQVIEFRDQRNALVDRMNEVGPQSEKNLTAIMESAFQDGDANASFRAGAALRSLLLARLYAYRFLTDNEQASYDRAIQEMTDFQDGAQTLMSELQNPTRRRLATELIDLAGEYRETFTQVGGVIFARNDLIATTLDSIGPQVADIAEDIKLDNVAVQDELGPRATADMQRTVLIIELVAGVAVMVSVLVAFFTARSITRPINGMTKAMDTLAKGDNSVEVPARDRGDEIGLMAAAVQVFKENALEVERLQAEQKQAEQRAIEEKKRSMNELADRFQA
ncbi:MAG: HAMP domain-containing protein, partial [Inquilinaceae bacterium]